MGQALHTQGTAGCLQLRLHVLTRNMHALPLVLPRAAVASSGYQQQEQQQSKPGQSGQSRAGVPRSARPTTTGLLTPEASSAFGGDDDEDLSVGVQLIRAGRGARAMAARDAAAAAAAIAAAGDTPV